MKRHLIYLVSFMTVFGLWSCSSDDLGLEVNDKQEVKSLVSVSATDAYNVLLESFISKSRSVEDISYPDFYGGAYIDKGELVILSPIRFLGKDNYEAILGRGNYRLEGCDYSYKELEDVMSIIDKYKLENKESSVSNNFYSYEISEKDNRVKVYLQEYSDEAIASFKNEVVDSPIIEFSKALGVPVFCSSIVYPGECIQPVNGAPGTAGYRAKYVSGGSTVYGFVTCAHVVPSGDDVKYNGKVMATGDASRWKHSGSIDATFCVFKNGYELSNDIALSGRTLSTTVKLAGVGTPIHKYGFLTSETDGEVTNTNATYQVGKDFVLKNATKVKIDALGGDSGSVVYGDTNITYGILSAIEVDDQENPTGYAWYIKATLINSEFGISRY